MVAAAAVGLAGVTGWMLAEGDRGMQVAAVLGFPGRSPRDARFGTRATRAVRGNPTTSRKKGEFEGAEEACQSSHVPTDQISVEITAFTRDSEPIDLCAITNAATTTVDNIIGPNGNIPTTLNRTSGYRDRGEAVQLSG